MKYFACVSQVSYYTIETMERSSKLRQHSFFAAGMAAFIAVCGAYILLLPGLQHQAIPIPSQIQDFLTLTLSIIVEALPFIVIGSLFSAVIQVFVPAEKILRLLPHNHLLRRVVISLFGAGIPACECGNVPVARGLLQKGLTPADSITFLLAAPIINPITILSTWAAFQFDLSILWIRLVAAFIIANIIGWLISLYKNQQELLTDEFRKTCEVPAISHNHGPRWMRALALFKSETLLMLGMLCVGAAIAGLTQVFIPREILASVGADPVLSIFAMLLLAFIISICSSMDAFFALAYTGTFTVGAIASFLLFGPMVDIKMLSLMKTTYKAKVLGIVVLLVTLLSILTGLVVNYAL